MRSIRSERASERARERERERERGRQTETESSVVDVAAAQADSEAHAACAAPALHAVSKKGPANKHLHPALTVGKRPGKIGFHLQELCLRRSALPRICNQQNNVLCILGTFLVHIGADAPADS